MSTTISPQGPLRRPSPRGTGFTLIEVIVVLVLLGLMAGLVAPRLVVPSAPEESQMAVVFRGARELSARRGELLQLRVVSTGAWRVESGGGPRPETLASGRLEAFRGPAFTLMISPLGTCAFDARSTSAARAIPLDPLTCELGEGNEKVER